MALERFARPEQMVKCVCGRRVRKDMMYDLAPLPPGRRPRILGIRARYVCDACREVLHRDRRLTKAAYLRYLNAPADLRAKVAGDRSWPPDRGG